MNNEHRSIDRLRKIAAEIQRREELDQGLRTARKEQLQMLPHIPRIGGYDFGALYEPAGEIGGDFYDFVHMRENNLGVIIGDVTGHGIEAAIIMGMAKITMSIYSRNAATPAETLTAVNRELVGNLLPSRFVSVSMLLLDVYNHMVTFCRAGHNPLILHNPKRQETFQKIAPKGTVIGVVEADKFAGLLEIKTIKLFAGDLLLLYTDGITEARNARGEEFGTHGLRETLKAFPNAPVKIILDKMLEHAQNFQGSKTFEDDVTLAAFRVKG